MIDLNQRNKKSFQNTKSISLFSDVCKRNSFFTVVIIKFFCVTFKRLTDSIKYKPGIQDAENNHTSR